MSNTFNTKIIAISTAFFLALTLLYVSRNVLASVFQGSNSGYPGIQNRVVHKDDIQGRIQQAAAEYDMGNIDEATKLYTSLIIDHPTHVPTLTEFANNLTTHQFYDHALACLRTIIDTYPSYPSSYLCAGVALNADNKAAQAIPYFEKALTLHANYPDAYLHMSLAWLELEEDDKAIAAARNAISLEPSNVKMLTNLGNIYNRVGQPSKARELYTQVKTLDPNNIDAEFGLGYADMKDGHIETAIDHFSATIERNPNHHDARLGRAFGYWALEDLPKAFAEYEYRLEKDNRSARLLPKPLWDGSDPKGKTILLHAEQGMGDTIQFCRFAKELKKRGARVVCGVQAPLMQLLALCPYIDEIRAEYTFDGIDYQAPIMSMGHLMNVTKDTIPTDIPYIHPDQKLVAEWKAKLAADKNLKVGICWHAEPSYEKYKSALSRRSVALKDFGTLASVKGVTFYSLQKVNGEDELRDPSVKLPIKSFDNFDDAHGRFMDTAALITNLDLVITVDTVIAHLAGALGKPVWTLLPYAPEDGRWGLKKSTTAWYPSMKLFRQQHPFNWQEPIAQVQKQLDALAHKTVKA